MRSIKYIYLLAGIAYFFQFIINTWLNYNIELTMLNLIFATFGVSYAVIVCIERFTGKEFAYRAQKEQMQ